MFHYSVHRAQDEADARLLVLQAFDSTEAFRRHSASVAQQIPRMGALLATPVAPPALFESISPLNGVDGVTGGFDSSKLVPA